MSNINCVVISGNLTADPKVTTSNGGTVIAKFRLAINDGYQSSSGEWVQKTHFVDCTAFGKTAEKIGKMVKKGQPLEIQGKLDYSSWEDDEGTKHSRLAIVVLQMHLMPKAAPKPQVDESEIPDHEAEHAIAGAALTNGTNRKVQQHDDQEDGIPF